MNDKRAFHPGLNDDLTACIPLSDGSCPVCADEGVPGRVIDLLPANMALAAMPDGEREIAIDLVENVRVGDRLLIHLGFAIARLPGEAAEDARIE